MPEDEVEPSPQGTEVSSVHLCSDNRTERVVPVQGAQSCRPPTGLYLRGALTLGSHVLMLIRHVVRTQCDHGDRIDTPPIHDSTGM